MTALTTIEPQNQVAGKAPRLPSAVAEELRDGYAGEWSSIRALSKLRYLGHDQNIPAQAQAMMLSCQPADRERLTQRLILMGAAMAPNRPEAEATAWVHETTRLLADMPLDILCTALDDHQRTSKFLPTVAEIRELAEPSYERRRRAAARLDAMARLIESGQHVPEYAPPRAPEPQPEVEPCTPEQAAAIMEEMGLKSETKAMLRRHLGPAKMPTREDYIALGVDPAVL